MFKCFVSLQIVHNSDLHACTPTIDKGCMDIIKLLNLARSRVLVPACR